MFESLASGLNSVLKKLRGKTLITEDDFNDAMRQVRVALLEADVALPIAKSFVNGVKDKVIGEQVISNVSPVQAIIKIVSEHLTEILGSDKADLNLRTKPPAIIIMVGLQGAGKTTTAAKLALRLKRTKKRVLLASLDVYRPAAQEQLEILGKQIDVACLPIIINQKPLDIAARAMREAQSYDVLILDTAGRLHVDDNMMNELKEIKNLVNPIETLLVADAMTGQDAVNIAKSFNDCLKITGIILTRIDGDSRGGAALSMRVVADCPIKFLAYGEKLPDLEEFYPERIAQRILNMGDVVSLVERANEIVGQEEIDKMQRKLEKGKFDLNDLLSQMQALGKMGGLASIMKFIPGVSGMKQKLDTAMNEGKVKKYVAIINSMTKKERSTPKILDGKRKLRISKGAGVLVNDVNVLLKNYYSMQNAVMKFSKMDHGKLKDADLMNLLRP